MQEDIIMSKVFEDIFKEGGNHYDNLLIDYDAAYSAMEDYKQQLNNQKKVVKIYWGWRRLGGGG